MSLINFCVEVRTNLLCANVHLQFDQTVLDLNNIIFSIENNVLIVKEGETLTRIPLDGYFSLTNNAIADVKIGEGRASLRLLIEKIHDVNFNLSIEEANDALNKKPNMQTNTETAIICVKCKCLLARNQKYERILEYPSGPVDLMNIYCHDNPHYDLVIAPKLFDLFYGFRFLVISGDLIEYTTINKDSLLYCKRCNQFLGEQILSGRAGKLWADYLLFKSFGLIRELWHKSTIKLPYLLLHKIVTENNCSIFEPFNFTKVIISSIYPNRKHKYIMMNILENNLNALRNSQHMKYPEKANSQSTDIQLMSTKGFKILYRLTTEVPPIEQQLELVNQWMENGTIGIDYAKTNQKDKLTSGYASLCNPIEFSDVNMGIRCIKISPHLFNELIYELDYNSPLLPDQEQHVANNFQMSYIFNSP